VTRPVHPTPVEVPVLEEDREAVDAAYRSHLVHWARLRAELERAE
jgi:hypothetical protein